VLPGLSWEAEDGEILSPFTVDDGSVYQVESVGNPESGGRAEYRFIIQEAGDYIVKATVNAADLGRNSFFVGMDGEPEQSMIWDVPVTNGYEEHRVFWRDDDAEYRVFSLSAGEHTLIIRGRERQTLLDKIEIVSADIVVPSPEITPTLPTITSTPTVEATQEQVSPTPTVVVPTATETVPPASPTPTESVPPTPVATESPEPPPPTATATESPEPPPAPTEEAPDTSGSETIYDDKDSAFSYSGGWRNVENNDSYGGSYKKTFKDGATATLDFVGQSFSVIYKTGPHFRVMEVYVDGQLVGAINQRSGSGEFQQSWDSPGQLSNGSHKLKLVFKGDPNFKQSRGSLDAVIVR
jgi:hypothetical protein